MIKSVVAVSLAVATFIALPAVGAEQFQCPFPAKPNDPAKLEQIKGLLPNVDTMMNIEKLSATIANFRREGMQRGSIIDHLVGAYCPMVAREEPLTAAEKTALVRALHWPGDELGLQPREWRGHHPECAPNT